MMGFRILLALLCVCGGNAFSATCTGPAPAANGSQFYVNMNSAGFAVLWYCKDGNGWTPTGIWGHWSELPGDWLYQVPKLLYGTDAERNAAKATEAAKTQPDYTATVKPLYLQLRSANDAAYPKPVAIIYRVTPYSAVDQTRTYYKANTAGTGVSTALGKVAALTVCGARLGTTNYYSVAGQKNTSGQVIAVGYANCAASQ